MTRTAEITIGAELPQEIEHWRSCSAFHTKRWADFTERTMRLTVKHAVIRIDQQVVGYVPVVVNRTTQKPKKCGPLLSGSAPQLILCDELTELQKERVYRSLHENAVNALVLGEGETSNISSFVLNMTGTFEDYWSHQVNAKAKYDVRKSEREPLNTIFLGTEGLDQFYPLYLKRMRELGSPGLSKQLFSRMADSFGTAFRFVITIKGDEVVAASTLLTHNGRWMGHPWSVSHSGFRGSSVNYAHYRDIIRYGFERGFAVFSMGPSLTNSRWCRIKRRFGALEYPVLRTDGQPVVHASQRLPVRLISQIIKRSPPMLYRIYTPYLAKVATKLLD